MLLCDLAATDGPACPLPYDNPRVGRFFIPNLDVVCPRNRDPGKEQPHPQFLILSGGGAETPCRIQSLGCQAHTCTSQIGGPSQVVTSELDHAVGGPITQRRRGGQRRSVGVRDVEIGLNRLVALVKDICEPGQQIGWHSIVCVEYHDGLSRRQWMFVEIPRQGRPLPLWPLFSFRDTGSPFQSDGDGSIAAAVGKNPDLVVVVRVVLCTEVIEQPADNTLFVMSRDHHPEATLPRPYRNSPRVAPTEDRDDQVVRDEGDQECFDGAEQNS